jgi:hypothetical protein
MRTTTAATAVDSVILAAQVGSNLSPAGMIGSRWSRSGSKSKNQSLTREGINCCPISFCFQLFSVLSTLVPPGKSSGAGGRACRDAALQVIHPSGHTGRLYMWPTTRLHQYAQHHSCRVRLIACCVHDVVMLLCTQAGMTGLSRVPLSELTAAGVIQA